MSFQRSIILLLLSTTLVTQAYSQIEVSHIGVKDNLPNRNILAIEQDNKGFLWLFTANGIARFDGIEFDKLDKSDILKSITKRLAPVRTINTDQNTIQFNLASSLYNLNTQTGHVEEILSLPQNNQIINHQKSDNSRITLDIYIEKNLITKSIIKTESDSLQEISLDNYVINDYDDIKEACIIGNDNKYIKLDDTLSSFQGLKEKRPINKARNFLYIKHFKDIVWGYFFHANQIFNIRKGEITFYDISKLNKNPINNRKSAFFQDTAGRIWFFNSNQLVYFENEKWASISTKINEIFDFQEINDCIIDKNGIIWLATINGLFKIHDNPKPFSKNLHQKNKNWGHSVRTIIDSEENGTFFYAEDEIGSFVSLIPGDYSALDTLNKTKLFRRGPFNTLYDKKTKTIWRIDKNKLIKIKPKSDFKRIELSKNLPRDMIDFSPFVWNEVGEAVLFIFVDKYLKIDLGDLQMSIVDNNENSKRVSSARKISKNKFILGTTNGELHYVDIETENSKQLLKPSNSPIVDIITIGEYKWIATLGDGIYVIKDNQIIMHLTSNNQLPNDMICSLVNDRDKYVWASTYNGLSRISLKTFEINNYFESDGLPSNEFNRYSKLKDSFGNILFGTINGFVYFDPKKFDKPDITYDNLELKSISYFDNKTEQIKSLPVTSYPITIPSNSNWFEINYVLLNYTNPKENTYQTKLVGYDKVWSPASQQSKIRYNAIPAGDYILKVQAFDMNAILSKKVLDIPIIVNQVWYKTTLAYLAYFLFTIIFIYLIGNLIFKNKLATEAVNRANELDAFKTKFFNNITHELKTPLTVIKGMSEKILDDPETYGEQGAKSILRNSNELNKLISEILELGKIDQNNITPNLIQNDIIPFLLYLINSYSTLAQLKNQEIVCNTLIDTMVLDYDPDGIKIIMNNIISNAIKYSDKSGKIEVYINRIEDQLEIKVQDQGIGISSENLQFVFNRYYQSKNTTAIASGTGIGLAVTKELINIYRGTIKVESELGIGTCFTIILPITNEAKMRETYNSNQIIKSKTPPIEHKPKGLSINKKTIVIVEDNYDIRLYLSSCLPDFNIISCVNGLEGYNQIEGSMPDLIITDLVMPIMDGLTMVTKIKQNEHIDHIPIIMLTAKSETEDRIEGIEQGVDTYLSKPFSEAELRTSIKSLIDSRERLKLKFSTVFQKDEINETTTNSNLQHEYILKCIKLVEENMEEEAFGVEDLAAEMNISSRTLRRKLNNITDITPSELILTVKMDTAKTYLEKGHSVKVTTYKVGYANPAHFSKTFKKFFGKSPSEV